MTSLSNPGSIVGLDGFSPLVSPDKRFHIHAKSELYLGLNGKNKYVGNVGDLVFERVGGAISAEEIIDVNDYLVPTLESVNFINNQADLSQYDWLVGLGLGARQDYYLAYVDKTVTPHRLCVDRRLVVPGSEITYCKLFRGSDTSEAGVVVSRDYEPGGSLKSENIPMEVVLYSNMGMTNVSVKTVREAKTNFDLQDGERITAVFYTSNGAVADRRTLVVQDTSYVRTVDAGKTYIVSIALESPFIDRSNPKVIRYPVNVPLRGMNLMAVITYSTGLEVRTVHLPVDQTKVRVDGFDEFVATQAGSTFKVILHYYLGADEYSYNISSADSGHISQEYSAVVLAADGAYGMKLYAYPVWQNAVSGYRLRWWLYNLRRNVVFEVTDYVKINATLSSFDPIGYGLRQRLSVSVNLRDVSPIYSSYMHTQVVDVVLAGPGSVRTKTNWMIGYAPNQSPMYGEGLYATAIYDSPGIWTMRLSAESKTLADWLTRIYRNTQPLYDVSTEAEAPEPTHFQLVINDSMLEYPIASWSTNISYHGEIINSSTLYLKFIRRTASEDLQLGVSGMPIYLANPMGGIIPV